MPEFECRREIELPATPEEVWEAVATPEGIESWLFPIPVAAGQGSQTPDGSVTTAWEPGRRYAARTEQGDWFNLLEFELQGRGGTTMLRYAHCGIFTDDWEKQYDAVQQHTDFYLGTLVEYLRHFKGRHGVYIGGDPGGLQAPAASMSADGFKRAQRALGLSEAAVKGQSVSIAPQGVAPLQGTVYYATPNFLGIRSADGLYCFFGRNAFGGPVGLSMHLFGDNVDAQHATDAWQNWLNSVYA